MYIGTLGVIDNDYYRELDNTTPDSDILALEFYKAVRRKTKYVIMEVSSHALSFDRVKYIDFKGAIYTNLTHDHLDYHVTMSNYLLAKQKLFNNLSENSFAIINSDDKYYHDVEKNCKGKIIHYGIEKTEFRISNISRGLEGIRFDLGKYENLSSKLLGVINVYNISAVFLCVIELGYNYELVKEAIKDINTINGRLEKVYHDDYCVILDYAHTPDAMEKVLVEVKPLATNRLIVLFGCGGNRDTTKRPLMGEIATSYADIAYITSDNPRFEDPLNIIYDVLKGCKNEKKIVIEENRELALKKALGEVENGDILMVLGKGHEEYQIIGNERILCSDKEMIYKWLKI
jgi:UDP-N-acetylmuramoyl-L-alanyl-D-glutamate--2,6-diaminopimelate ligase